MPTLAFDTHKAVKALKAAGADDRLAEAVVATVGEAIGGNVATKADLQALELRIADRIAEVKTDLPKVAIGIVAANAGLTFAIVRLLS